MAHSVRTTRQTRRVKSIRPPGRPVSKAAIEFDQPPEKKRFMAASIKEQEESALEARAVPESVVRGTLIERIVYKALRDKNISFDFQSSLSGGRFGWRFGRQVADFVLEPQNIVIEVQGAFWHSPAEQQLRDASRDLILAANGWTVLEITEDIVISATRLDEWLTRHIMGPLLVRQYITTNPLSIGG